MRDDPPTYEVKPLRRPFDATGDHAVRLPGSKSLTNRALLLAALAEGTTTLTGVLFADDTRRMMEALQTLGFQLDRDEAAATVAVHGRGGTIPNHGQDVALLLGNAGTATRFLTAACCLGEPGSSYVIDGIPRMRQRPIGELVDLLRQLGARIDYVAEDGFPPVRVHGGLATHQTTHRLRVGATLSSQYVSALLQIAPCLPRGLELTFQGPVTSKPYVQMTERMIDDFGGAKRLVSPTRYDIEPDASNASYFLAAASLIPDSRCEIAALPPDSVQGDANFHRVLGSVGVRVDAACCDHPLRVCAPRPLRLRGSTHDLGGMPDMAQTLAVVAMFAEGRTTIRHVGNLRVKETDRLAALENELAKFGAKVTITGDDLTIAPPQADCPPVVAVDTYDDHRMAMSFAVAGLASDRLPGKPRVIINDPGCVAKTYPGFWADLRKSLGAEVVVPSERSEKAVP